MSLLVNEAQPLPREHGSPGLPAQSRSDREPSHIPQLDGLRGIACLMVLVAHLKAIRILRWIPDEIATCGVGVFFVLSGFLITRILVATKLRGDGLGRFYSRRVARILPIYFLILGFLAIVWPGQELGWAADFSFNLRFVNQLREYFHIDAGSVPIPPVAHFWSLCVEEHFYWVWPFLVLCLPFRLSRLFPLACILATPAVTAFVVTVLGWQGLNAEAVEGLVSRWTITQLVGLSFGALMAFHEVRLLRAPRSIGAGLLLAGAAGFCCIKQWQSLDLVRLTWIATVLHTMCAGVFALGLGSEFPARSGCLKAVGRISYGLYLYHLPIYAAFGLAQSTGHPGLGAGLAALTLTFLVATLSFRWIEAPVLRFARERESHARWLSPGAVVSAGLMLAVLSHVVVFLQDYPFVPWELRFERLDRNGRITDPRYQGATMAYRWMGVVHCTNADGFRRCSPIPPKKPGVLRVATVGDSRTFGACVPADQVMAAVAERMLRARGVTIEVLNLGLLGGNAEDVQRVVGEKALAVGTDAIVYIAGGDDFESSRLLPEDRRTRPRHVDYFRKHLVAMDRLCRVRGVRFAVIPIVTNPGSTEAEIARDVEAIARANGVEAISVDEYVRRNASRSFERSYWDSHPNALCHRLYGEMISQYLLRNAQR